MHGPVEGKALFLFNGPGADFMVSKALFLLGCACLRLKLSQTCRLLNASFLFWIPAFAGMTGFGGSGAGSRLPGFKACAGMTDLGAPVPAPHRFDTRSNTRNAFLKSGKTENRNKAGKLRRN
jgi:hypothetical protein